MLSFIDATKHKIVFARACMRDLNISWKIVTALILLTVLFAIAEGFGIGLLLPILAFVENGFQGLEQNGGPFVAWIREMLDAVELPVTFVTLLTLAAIPMVFRQIITYLQRYFTAWVQNRGAASLRSKLLKTVIHADLRFFVSRKHGEIINSVLVEAGLGGATAYSGTMLCLYAVLTTAYLGILFILSWQLLFLTLPVFGVLALIVRGLVKVGSEYSVRISECNEKLSQELNESAHGIRFIKMRAFEPVVLAELTGISQQLARTWTLYGKSIALVEAIGPLIMSFGIFFVLYFAVAEMKISLSELGLFLFVALRLQQTVNELNIERLALHRRLVSLSMVQDFLKTTKAYEAVCGGADEFRSLKSDIRFENVSFSYDRESKKGAVIRDLSLMFRKGKTNALVGPSGSGKSTVVDLLVRHYFPDIGVIKFDGAPVEKFDLQSLRQKIGMVSQDTFLFHSSVRDNLTIGLKDVPADDVLWNSLELSSAADFVQELPDGLDAMLGERGMVLSGGQRQRLSLARALCQKPDILVLDEPASALDAASESAIRRTLESLGNDCTVIIIAHRIATIQNADHINYLEDGACVAAGSHKELLENCSGYKNAVDLQSF